MNATINVLRRRLSAFAALSCASGYLTASAAVNGPGVDITAFVRNSGVGNYTVEAGSSTVVNQGSSAPIAAAFDGNTAADADARVLIRNGSGDPTPARILYSIVDSAFIGYDFEVCSFTLYRVTRDSALERSPTEFKLEGWDGSNWKLLFETDETQAWDWDTYQRTYTIPSENRGSYRKYLFTVTKNGGDPYWTGLQEIMFHGNITHGLVWNGSDGARWNATDANWLDGTGVSTNWIPGAKAFFGERGSTSVTVEGTNVVGEISFSPTNTCTISGGTLAMTLPAEIHAGNGDIVASEMTDAAPVDVYKGYLDANETQPEYFPVDPDNKNQGSWILLWRNRKLPDITGFTGAVIRQGSDNRPAQAYNFIKDEGGVTASVQFQHLLSYDPYPIICVKLLLAQCGADVYGRIAYAKYSYVEGRQLGDDFDASGPGATTVSDYNVSSSGYGLFGVKPVGGELSGEPLAVSVGESAKYVSPLGERYLPKSATNSKTGDAVLCFPGCRVADLFAIDSAGICYNGSPKSATVHYFTNSVTNATVQVQGNTGDPGVGAQLCVKVEFTDGVGGVYARAVYAKYDWSIQTAHDFDGVTSIADIYDETYVTGAAYGVNDLVAEFKGSRVTFGAPTLTLDREITGDGTVRFAPLSGSQTVTVPAARTLDKVVFGGATTFAFNQGASLSVGTAEIEDAAAVNVSGESLLRIGTSKGLTKGERAHFAINGAGAMQDDGGWIVRKSGMTVTIR